MFKSILISNSGNLNQVYYCMKSYFLESISQFILAQIRKPNNVNHCGEIDYNNKADVGEIVISNSKIE